MSRIASLRWRLALSIALVAVLLSVGIGVAVYEATERGFVSSSRDEQTARAVLAASLVRRTGETLAGAEIDNPLAPAPLRAAVDRGRLATYRSGDAVWAGAPLQPPSDRSGRGIYVRGSFAADARALRRLRGTLLLVAAIGTAFAALAAVTIANGLSRRLRSAAAVADRVAGGDYGARIDATGGDEVARLARAVDEMADALAARLERERRFSADVAHELRTPLTGLTSAAELLDDSRPAQLVRQRVKTLRGLVDDLLELSRLEALAAPQEAEPGDTVDLADWVGRLVAERLPAARVEADGADRVTVDVRRLERVLANLLDNAARHGEPPVVVSVTGGAIDVRDHGGGFPVELLRQGPRRFWSASSSRGTGSGLGLTIAAGHAAAMGAELTLANAPGGGATARLTLAAPDAEHD